MEVSADELAGVADLFGALTPAELRQAVEELAFKRGEEASNVPIEDAIAEYRLVRADSDERGDDEPGESESTEKRGEGNERLLVPGPTAFPTLPPGAEDLPHILAVDTRTVDRDALAERVEERFRADAARAVLDEDDERIERLLDASYDLEAWGAIDLSDAREHLDGASASDG